MNLLLTAHTPTNEQLDVVWLRFRATPAGLAALGRLRLAATTFMHASGITVGHVAFALPDGCELTAHAWDEATEALIRGADTIPLPAGHELTAPPVWFGTDLHQLVVFPGGGAWLRCHPKASADLIEAEFTEMQNDA